MTAIRKHAVSLSSHKWQARMKFGNPPVVETAIGFYFRKESKAGTSCITAHFGNGFGHRYPESEFLPTVLDTPHPSRILCLTFRLCLFG